MRRNTNNATNSNTTSKSTIKTSGKTDKEYSKSKHKGCYDDISDESESFHTLPYFYQQKYCQFDASAIHQPKPPAIPIIEDKSEKYTPIPYIFRVPDNSNKKCIKTMARCPPFHVQLDHTIAVIWTLYASDEMDIPLGINQLHWAYSFLQNVKDKDSTYPRDVEHCMESITDELIEQYADMAEDTPSPRSSMFSFNPHANSTRQDVRDDESGDGKSCICGGGSKSTSQVRFADEEDSCSGSSSNEAACSKQPDYPFSVTYNDMKLHNYQQGEYKPKKKGAACNSADTKVNLFLNDMRKDQLKKILAELDRLHSIERYIGKTDKDFEPYIDDDDKELKEFLENKLTKENACPSDECEGKKKKEKKKKSKSGSSIICTKDSQEQTSTSKDEDNDDTNDDDNEELVQSNEDEEENDEN